MLEELKKIGLSDNEAKVYLALLEFGNATAQQLAQKAEVNRATTYVQLETLMKMGLASSFEKGAKTFFRIENPENLKELIRHDKDSLEERGHAFTKALPKLAQLFFTSGERPRVRFFEGLEGLRAMQKEFLKTKDKHIEGILSTDDLFKALPADTEDYTHERVKKGIRSKLIYTGSHGAIYQSTDQKMLRESRYIPPEKFPFSCDITIYENKVAFAALRDKLFGVIIESKEVADSVRALFSLAWDAAEKYQ